MHIQYRHFRKDRNPELFNMFIEEADLTGIGILPMADNKPLPYEGRNPFICVAATQCVISPDEGEEGPVVSAIAFCNNTDQFTKKNGRMIAYGRALKKLEAVKLDVKQTD